MSNKKQKVLIIGTGPLLEKGVKKIGGQCLRTWHFAKPVLDNGHDVKLLTIPIPDNDIKSSGTKVFSEKTYSDCPYISFEKNNPFEILPHIQKIHDEYSPDVILGINTYPSYLACSLDSKKPVWVDLNGWCMVEGQTKAYIDKNDEILKYFWNLERRICLRADKFSTVSEPQKLALIGELAALGRLNSFTFNWRFACGIPNAANEQHLAFPLASEKKMLRGVKVPDDAFILLWSGGFNTWTDVKSLTDIVSAFLSGDKKRYFVSTGGMVDGHDESTYKNFQELINKSPAKDRCIIEGWIETEKMLAYYSECDLGISIDSDNYETIFGARNRITNMLASGLPVITTSGSEISRMIEDSGAGWTIPIGENQKFIDKLSDLAGNREKLNSLRAQARKWAAETFSYAKTTEEVLKWLNNPEQAPDNKYRYSEKYVSKETFPQEALNPLEKEAMILEKFNVQQLVDAARDLKIIRSKPLYRLMMKIKGLIK